MRWIQAVARQILVRSFDSIDYRYRSNRSILDPLSLRRGTKSVATIPRAGMKFGGYGWSTGISGLIILESKRGSQAACQRRSISVGSIDGVKENRFAWRQRMHLPSRCRDAEFLTSVCSAPPRFHDENRLVGDRNIWRATMVILADVINECSRSRHHHNRPLHRRAVNLAVIREGPGRIEGVRERLIGIEYTRIPTGYWCADSA